MIVLDTNVVSEFMRITPAEQVVAWLRSLQSTDIWTTSVTVFEVQYGLSILPDGKRKRGLISQFSQALENELVGRILSLDVDAAIAAAETAAVYKQSGQGADVRDMQIGGIVAARSWTLATRNTKDFQLSGIKLIDPWTQ